MKKISILILINLLFIPNVFAATFSDVPENHTNYAAIESLKNLEIINGYPDGSFGPSKPVNRAEALKMILKSAKIVSDESVSNSSFSDVPLEAWFAVFVEKAKSMGIVNGNPDGTFAPERQVNKAEFLKMLLQSFKKDLTQHQNASNVSADTQPGQWTIPYLSYAKTVGIIIPDANNNLHPGKFLSRAECAEIIYKLLIIEYGGETQKLLSIAESNLVQLLLELDENDIQEAHNLANSAVFYSEKALAKSPDVSIVKAANKIALGFQKLCLAYLAGLNQNYEQVTQYVNEAKEYAGQAYNDDPSTQSLGKKIKEHGDILLMQIGN